MRKFAGWILVVVLTAAATSRGEDSADDWTGRLVMPKGPDVKLFVNGRAIDPGPAGFVLRVQRADGERLWVGRGSIRHCDSVLLKNAVAFFTAEIAREPTSFAYASRAGALQLQKHPFLALFDAQQALRLDPKSAAGYWNRGVSLIDLKDFAHGMADLDEALRLDPNSAVGHWTRAAAWNARREWDKSLADADAALRMDVTFSGAYVVRGNAWFGKGDLEKAVRDFDLAIQCDPTSSDAFVSRGWTWNLRHEWDQAVADFDEAIRLSPTCALAYNNRGIVAFQRSEYDDAMRDFDAATEHDAKLAWPYYNRGRIYNLRGEHARAVDELTKAIELSPGDVYCYSERAAAYYQLREFTLDHADRLMIVQLNTSRRPDRFSRDGQNGATTDPAQSATADTSNVASQDQAATTNAGTQASATLTVGAAGQQPAGSNATAAKPAPTDKANTAHVLAMRMLHNEDERYLDAERALEFATEACKLTEWKRATYLHTLAEAYAELGDFEKAVEWQSKAVERSHGDQEFLAKAKSRLELYRAGKSWRETEEPEAEEESARRPAEEPE